MLFFQENTSHSALNCNFLSPTYTRQLFAGNTAASRKLPSVYWAYN